MPNIIIKDINKKGDNIKFIIVKIINANLKLYLESEFL